MRIDRLDHLVLTVADIDPLRGVYLRDPDGNLLETSNPIRR